MVFFIELLLNITKLIAVLLAKLNVCVPLNLLNIFKVLFSLNEPLLGFEADVLWDFKTVTYSFIQIDSRLFFI